MKPPIVITTPFAGGERAAEVLGVPRARARWLIALAKESLREDSSDAPSLSRKPNSKAKASKAKRTRSRR